MGKAKGKVTRVAKPHKAASLILWEGPSALDGSPIVAVATGLDGGSDNPKTGRTVQVWIMRSDVAPHDAIKAGADTSVCGECPHRSRASGGEGTCYVKAHQAPRSVYSAYKGNAYARWDGSPEVFGGLTVRVGAYGDPAAVPLAVWQACLTYARAWTGYTHQWRRLDAGWRWLMASVDSVDEATEARAAGWRYFRVAKAGTAVPEKAVAGELGCLSETRDIQCITCRLCNGAKASDTRPSIVIAAHGATAGRVRG